MAPIRMRNAECPARGFNAPLAGVLFVFEELIAGFSLGLFAPLLVLGAVAGVLPGNGRQWAIPDVAIPGSVFAAV